MSLFHLETIKYCICQFTVFIRICVHIYAHLFFSASDELPKSVSSIYLFLFVLCFLPLSFMHYFITTKIRQVFPCVSLVLFLLLLFFNPSTNTHHSFLGNVQELPLRRTFLSGTVPLFTLFILKYLSLILIPEQHARQFSSIKKKKKISVGSWNLSEYIFLPCCNATLQC